MLKFSAHEYPYPSQRQSVFARKGMVAASQPLAAEAGIAEVFVFGEAPGALPFSLLLADGVPPASNPAAALAAVQRLRTLHAAMDTAVLTAYGFSAKKDLLAQLLELNLAVAGKIERGEPVTAPGLPPRSRRRRARHRPHE